LILGKAFLLLFHQVRQLSDVCDELDIPVLTYGLRTDFQGTLFEGSQHLMAWADQCETASKFK